MSATFTPAQACWHRETASIDRLAPCERPKKRRPLVESATLHPGAARSREGASSKTHSRRQRGSLEYPDGLRSAFSRPSSAKQIQRRPVRAAEAGLPKG